MKDKFKYLFHQTRRKFAKVWLGFFPKVLIIGVTGSYGKTSTVRAIAAVLRTKYKVLTTDTKLDTLYNLPITLLKLRPWHRRIVLEYGVDHENEMDYHLSLVKPKIAVLTGINPTHSERGLLGSLNGVMREKQKLLQSLPKQGLAIINADDEQALEIGNNIKEKKIFYGLIYKKDYWAEDIVVSQDGSSFILCTPKERISMSTQLLGKHFIHACLVASIIGREDGLTWEEIKDGLSALTPLTGRVSLEPGPKGSLLINDSLRANPASTKAGLELLAELETKGKRIAILGEMGELGESAEISHKAIGKFVAQLKIDYLVAIGPLMSLAAGEAFGHGMKKEKIFMASNVREAADILEKLVNQGDLLYLKGSLLRHLERIIMLLEDREVKCQLVSCHRYQNCYTCPLLLKDIK